MRAGFLYTSFTPSVLCLFILLHIPFIYDVFGVVDHLLENKTLVWLYFTYTLDLRLETHGTADFNINQILQDTDAKISGWVSICCLTKSKNF